MLHMLLCVYPMFINFTPQYLSPPTIDVIEVDSNVDVVSIVFFVPRNAAFTTEPCI